MADYTSNFSTLLTGHLGLNIGDPEKGGGVSQTSDKYHPQGKDTISDNLDIRDDILHAVAGGYTSFSDDDIKANFKRVSNILGQEKANKLFTQAFLFNQRPDAKKKNPEEKINSFFEIGSNDPDTKKTLTVLKNLGTGPQEGFRTSISEGNKLLTGASKKETIIKSPEELAKIAAITDKKTTQ